MKVLFFGGCHASTSKKIFDAHCVERDVQFDCIVNFQLIASGKPFPFEALGDYDAIVMSPIENKPGYNTSRIVEACRGTKTKVVRYPWVQWNGYFPYMTNGPFVTMSSWHHGSLPHDCYDQTFEAFQQSISQSLADANTVKQQLANTTNRLMEHEVRHDCDVRISEFIMDSYRESRLFLTPDHPAKPLYNYLISEISRQLDLEISKSFYWSSEEPQFGIRIPIPPEVSEVLDLDFVDADYQNFMSDLGQKHIPYQSYLRLLYGVLSGARFFRSTGATVLKSSNSPSRGLDEAGLLRLPKDSLVQMFVEGGDAQYTFGKLNWVNALPRHIPEELYRSLYLFNGHWRERPATASRW